MIFAIWLQLLKCVVAARQVPIGILSGGQRGLCLVPASAQERDVAQEVVAARGKLLPSQRIDRLELPGFGVRPRRVATSQRWVQATICARPHRALASSLAT